MIEMRIMSIGRSFVAFVTPATNDSPINLEYETTSTTSTPLYKFN